MQKKLLCCLAAINEALAFVAVDALPRAVEILERALEEIKRLPTADDGGGDGA